MEISIAEQTRALLLAGAAGVAFGLLYDILRIVRRAFKSALLTAALDLIFWLASAVGALCFMLAVTGGRLRLFTAVGAALGAAFYFLTLSSVVLAVGFAVTKILRKLLIFAARPIKALLRYARKRAVELKNFFKRDCKTLRERCIMLRMDNTLIREHRHDVGSGRRPRNEENEPGI